MDKFVRLMIEKANGGSLQYLSESTSTMATIPSSCVQFSTSGKLSCKMMSEEMKLFLLVEVQFEILKKTQNYNALAISLPLSGDAKNMEFFYC